MGSRIPECKRVAVQLAAEAAYGEAPTAANINQKLLTPAGAEIVPGIAPEIDFLDDLARTSEFLGTGETPRHIATDIDLNFNDFPATPESIGWIAARALGTYTATDLGPGSGDFQHENTILSRCSTVQLPSSPIALVMEGDNLVNRLYAGAVINTWSLSAQGKDRVTHSISLLTDGVEQDGSAVADPANVLASKKYFGEEVTILQDDFGGTLADLGNKARGFTLEVNNNLRRDDAKNFQLGLDLNANGLPELPIGDRTITLTIQLLIDEDDPLYADAYNVTRKMMQIQIAGDTLNANPSDTIIDMPECFWSLADGGGYEGKKRLFNITCTPVHDATDGPLKVTVTTTDASYQ